MFTSCPKKEYLVCSGGGEAVLSEPWYPGYLGPNLNVAPCPKIGDPGLANSIQALRWKVKVVRAWVRMNVQREREREREMTWWWCLVVWCW